MPGKGYIISKNKEGCKEKFAVVSRDSGRILGCHEKEADAINQLSAVYASEAGSKKK